ncbi:hypothetical protein KNE206_77830 [Kitasatospora sp. NE20-6]
MADRRRVVLPLEADGIWTCLLEHVQVCDDTAGRMEWKIRAAHRCARVLGRSRGGLTAKVHPVVDGPDLPLSIALKPGNSNDATAFGQVFDGIRIPRPHRSARTPPQHLLDYKAYSSQEIRRLLRRRGIVATIPERRDQVATANGAAPTVSGHPLRPDLLPRPQRGRTMLRPLRAVPCDRHPVR